MKTNKAYMFSQNCYFYAGVCYSENAQQHSGKIVDVISSGLIKQYLIYMLNQKRVFCLYCLKDCAANLTAFLELLSSPMLKNLTDDSFD